MKKTQKNTKDYFRIKQKKKRFLLFLNFYILYFS